MRSVKGMVVFLAALALLVGTFGVSLSQERIYKEKLEREVSSPATRAANPCAPKAQNPCAANPCVPKAQNPCAANPCAPKAQNPCAVKPAAEKAPKAGNPCAAR